MVLVSEGMYLLFIPGFTILAFVIGSILAFAAMSAKQEPADDEPGDPEAAH